MTTEEIPKLMFVDEWTEELLDKRIGQYHTYESEAKYVNSRFTSEIPIHPSISKALEKSGSSIHNASMLFIIQNTPIL